MYKLVKIEIYKLYNKDKIFFYYIMASIGNQNIIDEFKNAYIEDKNKQVLKSFPRNEQLSIVLLRRSAMQNDNIDDTDRELMMKYTNAVNELESDLESDYEENVTNKRKRKAEGFTKKTKSYGIKKRKAKKSKKQRKIKKKLKKTFRRF